MLFRWQRDRIALGSYPLISLSEARQKRDVLRKLLVQNISLSAWLK
ncbi:Arm DNA-binding domain-containing protein [Affinibrenneria salicis]